MGIHDETVGKDEALRQDELHLTELEDLTKEQAYRLGYDHGYERGDSDAIYRSHQSQHCAVCLAAESEARQVLIRASDVELLARLKQGQV